MLKFLSRKKKKTPEEIYTELFSDYEIPSFPSTVMGVLSVLRDPSALAAELVEKIELDPGLSIKVLRTVNSAAFGLTTRINHVGHAVSLLGRSRLESIVLSVAVNSTLPHKGVAGFDYASFWYTAAKRACLARLIARHLGSTCEIESFTEGLLLDMGVLFLLAHRENAYLNVYEHWQGDATSSLEEVEYDSFSYDHTEIGAIVAEAWSLPLHLIDAIKLHHDEEGVQLIEPAVHMVSLLRDSSIDDGTNLLLEVGASAYQIDKNVLSDLIQEALENAEDYQHIFAE